MDNIDMSQLLNMISKMDKRDLEKGLQKASKYLNTQDKDKIINQLKNVKK